MREGLQKGSIRSCQSHIIFNVSIWIMILLMDKVDEAVMSIWGNGSGLHVKRSIQYSISDGRDQDPDCREG